MKRFKELISKCKASVEISVNDHKDVYLSVEEHIKDMEERRVIDTDVYNKMIEKDTVVRLQFYPNTPVGSYVVYYYDVDKAINEALNLINIFHTKLSK